MKKLLATGITAALMLGGTAVAFADSGTHDPRDDNPNNDHGKCTAFFNGQKKGHATPTDEILQEIYDSCEGNIGGNPEENGRFADCFTDDDQDESTPSCTDGEG